MLHLIHRKHFHEYHFTTWRGCTIPLFPAPALYFCYLAHFSERYKHAGHYLGSSSCVESRLAAHREGHGARLMQVIAENSIDWELARLWPCETYEEMRATERLLKARHSGVKLCPICQHKPLDARVLLYHGHYPFHLFGQGKRQPIGNTSIPTFVRLAD
jgi:predicted GIY-YIG superfamily endonuclease